ncbi:MAG TPA: hypothetical protein VIZ43_15670 [Trebonia sp.]
MNDLREDLDRAVRAVPIGQAPVDAARRDGRRIRTRRRLTAVAGVLVVAAVAAGYPALAGSGASGAPAPLTGHAKPAPKPSAGHDMTVTAHPPGQTAEAPGGLTDPTGQIAAGAVGDMTWEISVVPPGKKNPVPSDPCYVVTLSFGDPGITGTCNDIPAALGHGLGPSQPATFTELLGDGTTATTVGETTQDVAFFIVAFADGQQLKLIPVTAGGQRYIAWVAPASMAVDGITAHLGGPYEDSGLTSTAVPFQQAGEPPLFGLWQLAGQAAPPRDTEVIGAGTTGGHAWTVTAHEGPWGTCFVTDPVGGECLPTGKLDTTTIVGWDDVSPAERGFGSAAPGVTSVRIALSNGKTVTAHPVGVGNEDLFAFPTGKGVNPTGWTAYNASGRPVGAGRATQPQTSPAATSGSL